MALRQKSLILPLVVEDSFKQIGLTLSNARCCKKSSVKDVSQHLRISVDYLTKLEAGAFDELPAPAYVIGFLRSYGCWIGLDPDALVARYVALTADRDTKPSYRIPMSTRPPQRSAPAVASMLVVFAGLAYGGWFWLKADSRLATDTFETATQTGMLSPIQESITIDVPSLDTPAIVDLATSKSADSEATSAYFVSKSTTVGTLMPSENKGTSTERLASKLASTDTTRFEPSVAQIPESGAEITDLTVADTKMLALPKTGTPSPVLLDELARTQILTSPNSDIGDMHNSNIAIANLRDPEKEITIRAVAASWVEIVRDNGEEVMAKLMQAGDSYVVEGNTRLYLSTGNAGGLMVVVGADEPLSMGAIGEIVRDLPLMKDRLSKAL